MNTTRTLLRALPKVDRILDLMVDPEQVVPEIENQAIIAAKAMHDESGSEDITPEIGGLWSWANDGGTFGMSLFGSYQERSSGSRGVNVSVYSFFDQR